MDNQSLCSSLGRTIFFCSQHSLVAYSSLHRLRPLELFSNHVSKFIVVALIQLVIFFFWLGYITLVSDISRRHNVSLNSLFLLLLKRSALLGQWSLNLRYRCSVVETSVGKGLHTLQFDWLWFPVFSLCPLQRNISLMNSEEYFDLWV